MYCFDLCWRLMKLPDPSGLLEECVARARTPYVGVLITWSGWITGTCIVNVVPMFVSWLTVWNLAPQCRVRIWVEFGSECVGESQQGQVPLHRTRQGQMSSGTNPGHMVSSDVLGWFLSGELRRLDASPHEGAWGKPSDRDSDTKLEDAGTLDGA
jgi:hypothetical protein